MKRLLYVILCLCLLLACSERQVYRDALSRAEDVMNDRPDSALLILDSLGQHEKEFGNHFLMQYRLHRLNAQNKTNVVFTSDSFAKALVKHFDRHGTTNERVLAHYLLGMAYSDMGEVPKAVNSFLDAIDAADTTVAEFNFHQLSCAYSQMATIYRRQLLLTYEIDARKKASHYAFRANQQKWGIYNQALSAGAYILLNKKDSAEIILRSALDQYRENGYDQEALRYSRSLIHLLVGQTDKLAEAKALMDQFEAESVLFDEHHELPPSQRQYYYYKGRYFEGINQLDSAEYYYRKIYRPKMSFAAQNPMYRGLLSVFIQRRQADSIAKYAQLYCMVNDSSIALKDQEVVAQMGASYNYNRLQKEVLQNEVTVYRSIIGLMIAFFLMSLTVVAVFLVWSYYRRKIKKIKMEFVNKAEEYEKNLHQLQLLELSYQKVIAEHTDSYSRIYHDYESVKQRLMEENERLQQRLGELQKNEAISKHIEVSEAFKKEVIVSQILHHAEKRAGVVKDHVWTELIKVFSYYFPAIYNDVCLYCYSPQNIRVCILTVLDIGNDDQAIMLDTTKQRVSNIRRELNMTLFNEASSRTLRKNLLIRYNIYGLER